MKVKIEVTVDIDEEAWIGQFDVSSCSGNSLSGKIRADVREYAKSNLEGQFLDIGVLK